MDGAACSNPDAEDGADQEGGRDDQGDRWRWAEQGGAGDHHSAEDPGEGGREERILFGEPDQEGEGGEPGEYWNVQNSEGGRSKYKTIYRTVHKAQPGQGTE